MFFPKDPKKALFRWLGVFLLIGLIAFGGVVWMGIQWGKGMAEAVVETQKVVNQLKANGKREIPIGYQDLRVISPLERYIDQKAPQKVLEETGCLSWEPAPEDFHSLLESVQEVSPTEWYAKCYQYPCGYKGRVGNVLVEYEFMLNAASYLILSNEEETVHFILEEKSDLFLQSCDCCEQE
ncbi:MAG: hypothetical protein AAF655_09290 [Bacteroidota bacterium]